MAILRIILVLAFASLLSTGVRAAELHSVVVLDTGPLKCSYTDSREWANPEAGPIYIRKTMLWHGVVRDRYADVTSLLYRSSDGMLFARFGQDRYANPSSPHEQILDFGDNYVVIPAGDAISAHYWCGWHYKATAHHLMMIWYTLEP